MPFFRSQAAAFLLLPLTCLCWAGNHVIARAAGGLVPPASANAIRWIIVSLVLLPLAYPHLRGDWPRLQAKPWMTILFGITGGGAFGTLQYVALQYTTALNMGVVGSVGPAFIVGASWLLFKDRLTPAQTVGVLVSLAGVLAIISRLAPSRLAGLSLNTGDLIILVNMACWAIYASCLRLRPAVHASTFMLAIALISVVSNLPFAAIEHAYGYHLQATWLTLTAILYSAFGTTLIAYAAWNRAVEIIGAPRAGAFLNTIPLFSALLATTLLGERIELFHILGFALILGGVTLVARQPGAGSAIKEPASAAKPIMPGADR